MEFLYNYKKSFEDKFISFIEELEINVDIKKSLKYSLINGGKRLRPWIISEISESIENLDKDSIDHICYSLEILHTTSLIHDDMPEIDNATLRRGEKANHLVFGEHLSLLAGDYGFVLPLNIISNLGIPDLYIKNRLFSLFSKSTLKLIEGETEDVIFEKLGKSPSKEEIINMYKKKTGELFGLSFSIPFLLKGINSTEEELGKNINTDENKQTLLNILGPEEVKKYADSLFEEMGSFLLNKKLENFYNKLISIKNYIEKK
jgi:geranylgeranyl pyrophosphate synthase